MWMVGSRDSAGSAGSAFAGPEDAGLAVDEAAAGSWGCEFFRRRRALKMSRRYVPSSISWSVRLHSRSYVAAAAWSDWMRNVSAEFRTGTVFSAVMRLRNWSWAQTGGRFSIPMKYCSY